MQTRDKILALAEGYLLQQGYGGFSYADIAKALNIKNAAIHYHFSSKEELVLAIIKNAHSRFEHWKKHLEVQVHWVRVSRFIKIYDNSCDKSDSMCLVTALCSDYALLPTKVQGALNNFAKAIHQWFSEILASGRAAGEFNFEGSASQRASIIQTSLMGGLLINRVMGRSQYEDIKNQLINDIQS